MKNMKDVFKKYFIPHESNEYHPHFFREEAFAIILAVSLGLIITSFGSSFVVTKTNILGNVYSSALVDLANKDRADQNLKTLTISADLEHAAQLKVEDMVANQYFAHTSPSGLTPWHWLYKVGYNFNYAGENLAIDFNESEDVNQAWLNSPLHRANILNKNFTEIGIATKEGLYNGKNTTFVVQMFGSPKIVAPKPVVKEEIKKETPLLDNKALAINASQELEIPEVKGINIENNISVIEENQSYMLFSSIDDAFVGVPDPVYIQKENKSYTTWYQRLFLNEPHIVQIAFTILMVIVSVALLLFVTIEVKVHRNKQVALGFMMLAIIIVLAFVNQNLLLTPYLLFN